MDIKNIWAKIRSYTKVIVAVLAVVLVGLSLLSLRCNPMVDRKDVQGLVLEIEDEGILPPEGGSPQARVLMAVVDTIKVRVLLPPPVPAPGNFIPLIAEHYRKGNVEYLLDLEKWQAEGPQ
jgi:hypothetical protein